MSNLSEQNGTWVPKIENPFEQIDVRLSNIENLLLDLKKSPTTSQQEQIQWFNIDELCNYLPDRPAKATVYGWVHAGTIPYHKGGKALRFLRSEIDEWLKSGRRKTNSEIAAQASLYIDGRRRKSGK